MKLIYLKEGRKYGVEELRACIYSQLDGADDAAKGVRDFFGKSESGTNIAQFFDRFKQSLNRIKKSVAGDGKTIARKLTNDRYVFRYVGLYDYVDIGNDSDADARERLNLTFFFMPKFVDFQEGTDCSVDLPDEDEDDDSVSNTPDAEDVQASWRKRVAQFASNNERNAVLQAIDRYNRELDLLGNPAGETKKHQGLLELAVRVLRDYLENGLYTKQQRELEHTGQGEIDWETTIDQYQPVFLKGQDGRKRPVYMDTATELANSDEDHYITRLHQCLVTTWGCKLEGLGLSSVLRVNVPLLSEEELDWFGTKEYQLEQIRKEMGVQFVTKSRHTLALMKELIERMSESQSANDLSLAFGMNGAEHLWEEACAKVLGSELDEKIADCGLKWSGTFRDYMPRPIWKQIEQGSESPDDKAYDLESKKSGWRLDFIRTWPPIGLVEKLVILDAKYYDVWWGPPDGKNRKIQGQPGIGDIAKQIFYQMAFQNLSTENKKADGTPLAFVNAFLFPEDDKKPKVEEGNFQIKASERVHLGWGKQLDRDEICASAFKAVNLFAVRLPGIELLRRYANGKSGDDWFTEIVRSQPTPYKKPSP
jgi:hypothetical protein